MEERWHKLKRAAIALVIVFVVFFTYNQVSKTPDIPLDQKLTSEQESSREPMESGDVEDVGPVGIGKLEMARFSTLNPKTKELEREFGFEKLLHEEGSQWEIEKPYMNIYRPDLTCFLTADKGFIVLEANVNPPSPKDATLIGNVKAHIVPTQGSSVKEAYIFIDDLSFFSDKSQFSSKSPIRCISDNVMLKGKGLDLIYDEQNKRLTFLRLHEIHEMRLRSLEDYSLTKSKNEDSEVSKATRESVKEESQAYKCIFRNNVSIDTGDELIATNTLTISNIVWDDSSDDYSTSQNVSRIPDKDFNESDFTSMSDLPDDMTEVIVSCPRGFILVPDEPQAISQAEKLFAGQHKDVWNLEANAQQSQGRTYLVAEEIDYNVLSSEAVAGEKSIIQFYIKDIIDEGRSNMVVPVTVRSYQKAVFYEESNQILFQGDCQGSMVRYEQGMLQEYQLTGDRILVQLKEEYSSADTDSTSIDSISIFGDDNNWARLSGVKKAGTDIITGVELKCRKFKYESGSDLFSAYGPGVIKIDNSKIPPPGDDVGPYSLQRPSYAVIDNFDELNYYMDKEKIVAYNEKGRLYIDYFPIIDLETQQVSVTAGRVEIELVETKEGHYRLWATNASKGISYKDEDKVFEGSEFSYNDNSSMIKAKGSEDMPAFFNRVPIDAFEINVKTGEFKDIPVSGPAYFQTGN